jgi:hypothetical protein
MILQYPHILTGSYVAQDATRDATGNWVQTGDATEIMQVCRAERSNGYQAITTNAEDGTNTKFSFVVYMPATAVEIPAGTTVEIAGIAKGKVLQFLRGQLNARLWL